MASVENGRWAWGISGRREETGVWGTEGEERKAFSIAGGMLSLARSMIGESNRQREEGPMGGHGTGVSWERLAEEAAGMPEGSECGDLLVPWQTGAGGMDETGVGARGGAVDIECADCAAVGSGGA
jgi:hypothetical protein